MGRAEDLIRFLEVASKSDREVTLAEKADIGRINNTMGKMAHYLSNHQSICVSVSGGSDSDSIVHIIATYFRKYLPKIHFVFANTGIEYRATLEHLNYLREHYNIQIDEVQGTPIPIAVKKYGIPFLSKQASEYLGRLIKKVLGMMILRLAYYLPNTKSAELV
ncbi:MAG: phosphoadenosine phosphosulfate reductase domain-containing protein [bacterium]